jgi:hypothetical protein
MVGEHRIPLRRKSREMVLVVPMVLKLGGLDPAYLLTIILR